MTMDQNNPPHSAFLGDSTKIGQKRRAECDTTSIEKKPRTVILDNYHASDQRHFVSFTQTQTPICSHDVTKPIQKTQEPCVQRDDFPHTITHQLPGHGYYNQVQDTSTTMEQLNSQLQGSSSSRFNNPASSHFSSFTKNATTPQFPWIVDASNTPEDGLYCEKMVTSNYIIEPADRTGSPTHNTTPPIPEDIVDHRSASNACSSLKDDEYPLDDDTAQILTDLVCFVNENQIPPSSVQGWGRESRSPEEYDSTLKFSPPEPLETDVDGTKAVNVSGTPRAEALEDLLDEDVDWNTVLAKTNLANQDSPLGFPPKLSTARLENMHAHSGMPDIPSPHGNMVRPSGTFVRPPFPEKIRDRPSVPGMSSGMLLRTCFRIGAMISQTKYCFNHQQDVVFELYARVTYSSRETLVRKQHFQFVDLSKDQQPYPTAVLTNWRTGSQLDKDSLAFLGNNDKPQFCWCMCKPMKDLTAVIGWTYTILKIKPTTWENIEWAQRVVCGDPEESRNETISART